MIDVMENIKKLSAALDAETASLHLLTWMLTSCMAPVELRKSTRRLPLCTITTFTSSILCLPTERQFFNRR